jgi:hypothetical protein
LKEVCQKAEFILVRKIIFFILLLSAALFLTAEGQPSAAAKEDLNPNLNLRVVGLKEASPPEIFEDSIIFSSGLKVRFVGVAFAHEHYAIIHPMRRNQHGIFFLVYPIPVKSDKILEIMSPADTLSEDIRYRLMVDGQWTYDASNKNRSVDGKTGVTVSVLEIPFLSIESPGIYPILDEQDGDTARFRYRGEPGSVITVAGSFNDWDPFMYEMEEIEDGLYTLTLKLPRGIQRYAFIDRGRKVADALNPDFAYTPEGTRVSVLQVP